MATQQPPVNWAFSRDGRSTGGFGDYTPGHGIVLNAEDPNLDANVQAAKNAGVPFSIWIPADTGRSPEDWAHETAAIQQRYHPTYVVPDIEFQGYNNGGDAGVAQWAQQYSAALQKLGVDPASLAISTMPNKSNFVSAFPGATWMPQTYGANPQTDFADPKAVVNSLIQAGVDPSKIIPLLAPSQSYDGAHGEYTIDDLSPQQRAAFLASLPPQQQAAAAQALDQGQSSTDQTQASAGSDMPPQGRTLDSHNPAAIAYSRQQLARMAKLGYTPDQFGLQGLDPTAQWRAMSSIMGARQAIASGHAADYQLHSGIPSPVSDVVNQLIQKAVQPAAAPAQAPFAQSQQQRTSGPAQPIHRVTNDAHLQAVQQVLQKTQTASPFQNALNTAAAIRLLRVPTPPPAQPERSPQVAQ